MNTPLIAIASLIYGDEFPPGVNYCNAVERAGGRPLYVCRTLDKEDVDFVLQRFDGLLLTGGGDLCPETLGCPAHEKAEPVPLDRDRTEVALARAFFAAGKPILAVCRGEQVLNVALGGTHCQHIFDRPEVTIAHQNKETRHEVRVVPGTLLHRIFGGADTLRVNSTHHQAVESLAPCFSLAATSPDGVIEAYSAGETVLATQWHPERLLDEGMMPIWDWFIGACRG